MGARASGCATRPEHAEPPEQARGASTIRADLQRLRTLKGALVKEGLATNDLDRKICALDREIGSLTTTCSSTTSSQSSFGRITSLANCDFKVKLGAVFPNFVCQTTQGTFTFHEFLSRIPTCTVLFSHPADFSPASTSELGKGHELVGLLKSKGVKLIGLSCSSVKEHHTWSADVFAANKVEGSVLDFPIISDPKREIAAALGMLDPREKGADGLPMPARAMFFIGPNKTNRLTSLYPGSTGRNIVEVLRVIDSLLYTQDFNLATPANWKDGERMIVAPFVTTEDARKRFKNLKIQALPSGKEYLRYVDCVTWETETLPSGQSRLRFVEALPTPVSMVPSEPPPSLPSAPAAAGDYTIKLGAVFPDFDCRTTKGNFKFHEFLQTGAEWTVLFSHPKDFTPVCTTEIGKLHTQVDEYHSRGVKLIGLSCDSVEDHKLWSRDVLAVANEEGEELAFPIIADEKRELAAMLGMLDPLERDAAAMPLPARALFIIGPDKTNRLTLLYPATTGRDFSEVLRVIDSLKYTADVSLATPANWKRRIA